MVLPGLIDHFKITYNYTINWCLETGDPVTTTIPDRSARFYTLRGLNEDSNYKITVTTINSVGSAMSTITAYTLTSGIAFE